MTTTAILDALLAYLKTQWGSTTPVAWPNVAFTPPAASAWIRPTPRLGMAEEREKGVDGLGLRAGVLIISIFQPLGAGVKTATGHADTLEALYRRKTIGGVMCGEPYTEDRGDDGFGFYHLQTFVPFQVWTGE